MCSLKYKKYEVNFGPNTDSDDETSNEIESIQHLKKKATIRR